MSISVQAIETVNFGFVFNTSRYCGLEQKAFEKGSCPREGTLEKYAANRSTSDKLGTGNFFDFDRVKSGVAPYK
jgi:hypothetical protein